VNFYKNLTFESINLQREVELIYNQESHELNQFW